MDIAKAKAGVRGRHAKKRIGRGTGSGHGKTSGRGHKGQKARSSVSVKILAEGGQRPLFRRLPKRGFNNTRFKSGYHVVNIGELEAFEKGARVDAAALREAGLVRAKGGEIKILGGGELTKALVVVAHKFSQSALEKIAKAGGSTEVA